MNHTVIPKTVWLLLALFGMSHAVGNENLGAEGSAPPEVRVSKYQLEDLSREELAGIGLHTSGRWDGITVATDPLANEAKVLTLDEEFIAPTSSVGFADWPGYNATQSDMTWIAAGDDLGLFSLQWYPGLPAGKTSGIRTGMGFHFLNGPSTTDLPPRLFDFELAYQTREIRTDHWMLDIRLGVGAFSDFEGSARKGVRFPGHIVNYYEVNPWLVTVFGAESLDRDDISVLPVAGVVWIPNESLMLEMVFPRPKIQWQFHTNYAIYFSGELGGGTWAVERDDRTNDNVTYRDLRFAFGLTHLHPASETVLEFGFATDRALEFRSGNGDQSLDDSLMLRLRHHF